MARREPGAGGLPTGWLAVVVIVALVSFVRYKLHRGANHALSDGVGPVDGAGLTSLAVFLLALAAVTFLGCLLAGHVGRRVPPEELERRAEELAREWLEEENERKRREGEGRARPTDP